MLCHPISDPAAIGMAVVDIVATARGNRPLRVHVILHRTELQ